MNLFRSEDHARNWSGFSAGAEGGLLSLDDLMKIYSADLFRRRADEDYVSSLKDHFLSLFETVREVTHDHPFWRREG